MSAVLNFKKTFAVADSAEIFYPESDGKPMAETDKHINLLIDLRRGLERFFAAREDVYVTGKIMFYYIENAPEECVSPDVMVCFGVPKGDRRTYKVWEENDVAPSVIIEIASRSTFKNDRTEKKQLYAWLGVKEYFIYNPEYPKTLPSLIGFKLNEGGNYVDLEIVNNRLFSEVLELELVDTGDNLRLYNSQTSEFLLTFSELVEREAAAQENARRAESEIERLKAEIARLTNESNRA